MVTDVEVMFTWLDYILFFLMLICSALIGIYFGCKKNTTKEEYLLGGKSMKVFPVAISLIASNISGIILMAVPADVYQYGASFIWSPISMVITIVTFIYIYMPVLLKQEYNTIFEYLEIRFNKKLRLLASTFFILQMLLNNPIVIFVPTLAFAQVSGLSIHGITIIVCSVCIFYTAIGGLKAVIWTDTLQTISMYICITVIFIMGLCAVGGFTNVWDLSVKGERLDVLKFNVNFTDRDNFWSVVIGFAAICLNNVATHQATIQRLTAVPSYSDATKVLWIFLIGIIATNTFATVMGLLVYAHYAGCDPITLNQVSRYDQILPYFVIDVAGKIMGLSGLFIAGIFSAALSTLSTNLNTLSAVIYTDFLSAFISENIKKKHEHLILKLIVILTGAMCIGGVFIIENLGGIIPLATRFLAITGGPLLGLFTLGITVPKAHSKGALIGGITGMAFITWMTVGNYYYQNMGAIEDSQKPVSIDNCTKFLVINKHSIENDVVIEKPFILYRINFWYYAPLGWFITIIVGYLASITVSGNNKSLKSNLIAPWFRFLLLKDKNNMEICEVDLQLPLSSNLN